MDFRPPGLRDPETHTRACGREPAGSRCSIRFTLQGPSVIDGKEAQPMAKRSINVTDESNGVFKTIFLLAWPVFLEQIFTTLVGYADTAMVGSMGAAATAADGRRRR